MITNEIKSIISHDKESNRVYLRYLHPADFPHITDYVETLASRFGYTKIFAKVPASFVPEFFNLGYNIEAFVPDYFKSGGDVFFMCNYKENSRRVIENDAMTEFQTMLAKSAISQAKKLTDGYIIRILNDTDIGSMIDVFKEVFESYPFPIFDPLFLQKSMTVDNTRYFGIFHESKLVAVSSAECDVIEKNAEMTDFAVLPNYRGKSLANILLAFMEKNLVADDFKMAYTICRLKSIPMNKTFYVSGYKYTGTLIKNTQISGRIESMNVWYKNLSTAKLY